MPDPEILQALRSIAPDGVGCAWADPKQLYPLEDGEGLPKAIPARLAEYSAGRAAAKMALTDAGLPVTGVPHGPDRAPVWPAGVVGSITHTSDDCLAVVAHQQDLRGVGIDLEPNLPLDRQLWPTVLRSDEQADLSKIPECHAGRAALLRFVAKEAAYKAQYAVTGQMLDFIDLTTTFQAGCFTATFTRDVAPFGAGDGISGRLIVSPRHCLCLAMIPA